MASITKRSSGYYQVRIRRRGHAPVSRGFIRRADAEAWARKTESELERGVWRDSSPLETTTLKGLIDTYRERELPKKCGAWFAPALRSLNDHLGRYPLSALTSRIIADYRDVQVKRHGRAASVRLELSVLSSMLDLAIREWDIPLPSNPCKMVTRPPQSRGRTRRVEAGELGPPCQNSCRLVTMMNLRAIRMRDGTVRGRIQESGGGANVAAGERCYRRYFKRSRGFSADIGEMA